METLLVVILNKQRVELTFTVLTEFSGSIIQLDELHPSLRLSSSLTKNKFLLDIRVPFRRMAPFNEATYFNCVSLMLEPVKSARDKKQFLLRRC